MALENALERPGISQEVIDELVSRRLLRFDERQKSIQRVELAHDVLIGVVTASRDARHQQQKEAAERERVERQRAEAEARVKEEHERAERERLEKERFEELASQADRARKRAEKLIDFMLYDLSTKLSSTGQLQLLAEVNDKTIEYFDGFEGSEETDTIKWSKAFALQSRGSIRMDAGKVTEAFEAESSSLAIFREFAEGADATDVHRNAVASQCSYLAWVLMVQGKSPAALELYKEAFDITQGLLRSPSPQPFWSSNLAYYRDRIGDVMKAQGRLDEAMKFYYESFQERAARKEAAGEAADSAIQIEFSDSYLNIGDGLRAQGRLAEALKYFEDSLAIRKQLVEGKKQDVSFQHSLSQSYDRVGECLQAFGKVNEALEAFKQSDEIFERLIVLDTSANWNRNYSVTRARLAEIQNVAGSTAIAGEVFSRVLVLRQVLANIDESSADAQEDLADAQTRVGDSAVLYGKLKEASENYQLAFDIRSKFADKEPSNAERQARLADAFDRLGDLLSAQGNFTEGLQRYTMSRGIRDRLAQTDSSNLARQSDLATSIEKIGDAQAGLAEYPAAHESYAAAVLKREELGGTDPENAQWQAQLALASRPFSMFWNAPDRSGVLCVFHTPRNS